MALVCNLLIERINSDTLDLAPFSYVNWSSEKFTLAADFYFSATSVNSNVDYKDSCQCHIVHKKRLRNNQLPLSPVFLEHLLPILYITTWESKANK